ncbi:MAG: hypothetical protein ACJ71T_14540 [Actinomycetales bacterium]
MKIAKRILLVGATVLPWVVMAGTAAVAAAPTTAPVDIVSDVVITDLCAFPVAVHTVLIGTETDFTDSAGNLVMIVGHGVFTDTFSANGVTLAGEPYHGNARATLDSSGNVISVTGQGVTERVPLPDGSVFFSAGRVDFLAHTGDEIFVPDTGRSGDVAALCQALSG